jgi:hypothetical protein
MPHRHHFFSSRPPQNFTPISSSAPQLPELNFNTDNSSSLHREFAHELRNQHRAGRAQANTSAPPRAQANTSAPPAYDFEHRLQSFNIDFSECPEIEGSQLLALKTKIAKYIDNDEYTTLDLSRSSNQAGLSRLPSNVARALRSGTTVDLRGHLFIQSPLSIEELPANCKLLLSQNPISDLAITEMLLIRRQTGVTVYLSKNVEQRLNSLIPSDIDRNRSARNPSLPAYTQPPPQYQSQRLSQETYTSGASLDGLTPYAAGVSFSSRQAVADRARNARLPNNEDYLNVPSLALALRLDDKVRIMMRYLMAPNQQHHQVSYFAVYRTMYAILQASIALQRFPARPDVAASKTIFFSAIDSAFAAAPVIAHGTPVVAGVLKGVSKVISFVLQKITDARFNEFHDLFSGLLDSSQVNAFATACARTLTLFMARDIAAGNRHVTGYERLENSLKSKVEAVATSTVNIFNSKANPYEPSHSEKAITFYAIKLSCELLTDLARKINQDRGKGTNHLPYLNSETFRPNAQSMFEELCEDFCANADYQKQIKDLTYNKDLVLYQPPSEELRRQDWEVLNSIITNLNEQREQIDQLGGKVEKLNFQINGEQGDSNDPRSLVGKINLQQENFKKYQSQIAKEFKKRDQEIAQLKTGNNFGYLSQQTTPTNSRPSYLPVAGPSRSRSDSAQSSATVTPARYLPPPDPSGLEPSSMRHTSSSRSSTLDSLYDNYANFP